MASFTGAQVSESVCAWLSKGDHITFHNTMNTLRPCVADIKKFGINTANGTIDEYFNAKDKKMLKEMMQKMCQMHKATRMKK